MIRMHARQRRTDRRMNIMAIARWFVLTKHRALKTMTINWLTEVPTIPQFSSKIYWTYSIMSDEAYCNFYAVAHWRYCYSASVGERSIAISLSVCLCVCLRAYLWNRWTDLHEICCADLLTSVFLWRRCDTLCTSDFMDDVTCGRNGPHGDAWLAALRYRGGAESDVYECLVEMW